MGIALQLYFNLDFYAVNQTLPASQQASYKCLATARSGALHVISIKRLKVTLCQVF